MAGRGSQHTGISGLNPWNFFRRPSSYVDKLLKTYGQDEEVLDAQIVYELHRVRFLHRTWLARLLWKAWCRFAWTRYNRYVKPRMDKLIANLKREAEAEDAQQRRERMATDQHSTEEGQRQPRSSGGSVGGPA